MEISNDPIDHPDDYDADSVGPEKWVRDAIAQQEERIKRTRSCMGQVGRAHAWRQHGAPAAAGAGVSAVWDACVVCGVTRTDDDYKAMLHARRRSVG